MFHRLFFMPFVKLLLDFKKAVTNEARVRPIHINH